MVSSLTGLALQLLNTHKANGRETRAVSACFLDRGLVGVVMRSGYHSAEAGRNGFGWIMRNRLLPE